MAPTNGTDGTCPTILVMTPVSEENPTGIVAINRSEYEANPDQYLLEGQSISEKYEAQRLAALAATNPVSGEGVGAGSETGIEGVDIAGQGGDGDTENLTGTNDSETGKIGHEQKSSAKHKSKPIK